MLILAFSFFTPTKAIACNELLLSLEQNIFKEIDNSDLYYREFYKKYSQKYPEKTVELGHYEQTYLYLYGEKLNEIKSLKEFQASILKIKKEMEAQILSEILGTSKRQITEEVLSFLKPDVDFEQETFYLLARQRLGEKDHIEKVFFESHMFPELIRDYTLKRKTITALNMGKVTSNVGQSGIKRVQRGKNSFWEVKLSNSDQRLWGCVEDGVLILKGFGGHKKIDELLSTFNCP